MTQNPYRALQAIGVEISYDNIGKELISSGEFARMVAEDAVVGLTANPLIYSVAVSSTSAYDGDIVELRRSGMSGEEIAMELWARDIQAVADILRPVYENSGHLNGYASIELPPSLAHDGPGTSAAAHEMWHRVNRPNVAFKIPATREGIPAVEECVAAGMNINATVIFSPVTYEAVANAYARGLSRRQAAGQSLDVMSFASVFVSRYDAPVDAMLMERIRATDNLRERSSLGSLLGTAAIANCWSINRMFHNFWDGPMFTTLRTAGCHPQRPLWAGVVARNPRYGAVYYVEALAIPGTTITMSDPPFRAFGTVGVPVPAKDTFKVDSVLQRFDAIGIDLAAVALEREEAVVVEFTRAFDGLASDIEKKGDRLMVGA